MARIINLTPHAVNIIAKDGSVKATYPSEGVARATQHAEVIGELNGVELVSMKFGETVDLPAPAKTCDIGWPCSQPHLSCEGCPDAEKVYYIVSIITANAAKANGRSTDDLIITADPVRNDEGQIIGCERFALV